MIFLSMRNLPEIRISIEELSKQASMSVATVKRKLKSLEEKGFINRIKKGVKNTTVTKIVEQKLEDAIKKSRPDIYNRLRKIHPENKGSLSSSTQSELSSLFPSNLDEKLLPSEEIPF